jgi:hypothetical protein
VGAVDLVLEADFDQVGTETQDWGGIGVYHEEVLEHIHDGFVEKVVFKV